MTRDELTAVLEKQGMSEIIELIEDAENGYLEELELAPSIGLLRDDELNKEVLNFLEEQGVTIIYMDEEVE
ncbi:hypothetical protein MM221_19395 [Salipaludibacillus sp. LMS25]|jgi:hypothetical protein|uniref:hypothetical protein n=1 Tax=Salipaludibacillus sp. LMS25 TaxID=2924031 RepID=UPI0020D0FF89|nr:hypothetical protein [Salipaludibacillus sp. LMS25]UTR14682.1 hypothetical protein MM221_19395 [Salipaludibacillus sp. LMS25]